MTRITLALVAFLATAAFADDYTPVDQITVDAEGKIIINLGFRMSARCVYISTGSFSITESRWQVRATPEDEWVDVPGTKETGGACGYVPEAPGEYRLPPPISGTPHKEDPSQ